MAASCLGKLAELAAAQPPQLAGRFRSRRPLLSAVAAAAFHLLPRERRHWPMNSARPSVVVRSCRKRPFESCRNAPAAALARASFYFYNWLFPAAAAGRPSTTAPTTAATAAKAAAMGREACKSAKIFRGRNLWLGERTVSGFSNFEAPAAKLNGKHTMKPLCGTRSRRQAIHLAVSPFLQPILHPVSWLASYRAGGSKSERERESSSTSNLILASFVNLPARPRNSGVC